MTVDLNILVDRSGSMQSCRSDMEGGLNTLLQDQKKDPQKCQVSLYEFDDQFKQVFKEKDVHEVPHYELNPRGLTALLDALGRSINMTGVRLTKMKEGDRSKSVIFVVITDGLENASKEYSREKVYEMIKHQTEVYSWQFIYLGANQDAIAEGQRYGFLADSSMTYNINKSAETCSIISQNISQRKFRGQAVGFSEEEREEVK